MPGILSDILRKPRVHKECDNPIHEDVDVVIVIVNGGGINNHDHALKDVQTLGKGVTSKNESILLVCATNRKEYRLIWPCTQSIKYLYAYIEENVDLMEHNVEKVSGDELRNYMLFVDEDGSIYDLFPFLEPSY